MSLNIVLVQPEIPQNTGNIIRTCAAINAKLHLVKPLGFSMEDKYLKRSGLDYLDLVEIIYYDSIEELFDKNPNGLFYYATTKAKNTHSDVEYKDDTFLVFGKETKGLDEKLLDENKEYCIRIPMLNIERARSLNLSNSVAIVAYEVLRQLDYPKMR